MTRGTISDAELSEFQRGCLADLLSTFSKADIPAPSHTIVRGETENYVHGTVATIEFWIYDDGAGFTEGPPPVAAENQWIYEWQDYKTLSDLAGAFVEDLARTSRRALETDRQVQNLASSFASECREDFVGLWAILWEVKRSSPELAGPEVKAMTLEVVRRLLESREIAVGDLDSQRGFLSWPTTSPVDATIAELGRRWTVLGRDPDIGECAWLARIEGDPGSVLEEVGAQLNEAEIEAIAPLFAIDASQIDERLSNARLQNGLLICDFVSVGAVSCPFELHFSRSGPRVLSFFIGSGAEFYNDEGLQTPEDRIEVSEDLDRFLRSAVHCERVLHRGSVAKETYTAELLRIDGHPIEFVHRPRFLWPFQRTETESLEYRPWLGE